MGSDRWQEVFFLSAFEQFTNGRVEILDEGFGTARLEGCCCDRKLPVSIVIFFAFAYDYFSRNLIRGLQVCATLRKKIIRQTHGKLKKATRRFIVQLRL